MTARTPTPSQMSIANASALCIAMAVEEMNLNRLVSMGPDQRAHWAKEYAGLEREEFLDACGYLTGLIEARNRQRAQLRDAVETRIGRA